MIRVSKFTVSTADRQKKQSIKDASILPQNGGFFEFVNGDDLNEFMEQLRMAFEFNFVFGCTISATMANGLKPLAAV